MAIRILLSDTDHAIREATNGREALEMAQQKPDLIILDVDLPDIDGFEVCRKLMFSMRYNIFRAAHVLR